MKVLLVGNYLLDAQQSMSRFCTMLETELRKTEQTVQLIRPEARLRRGKPVARRMAKWLGYADKFILFPGRLRIAARAVDVVHICDHAYSLYTRHLAGKPQVITCHDLLAVRCALGEFPSQRTRWSGRQYQKLIVDGLERAYFVACDSEATRSDLLRLAKIPENRTALIHAGLNFPYRPTPRYECRQRLARLGVRPKDPFIMHVGTDVWYKNLTAVVRIFDRLISTPEARNFHLVMVGDGPRSEVNRMVGERALSGRVKMISNITNDDLQALYSAASGLLFPSLCEGFGWPVVEAQACGCPVFASNRPPMTEMGGDAAVYFDPQDCEGAAELIRRNLWRSAELRSAGLVNSRRFSAGNMAAAYVDLYARAVAAERYGCANINAAVA